MQIPKNGLPLSMKACTACRTAPPPCVERGRAGAERPLTGDHQLVGARQDVGVGADDRLRPDAGERLLDAAEVAAAEIGDDDLASSRAAHAVSVPLVDGTPTTRGSIRTAAEVARANALNSASIMWCAFSP